MSAKESQKAAEDTQNKNINDSRSLCHKHRWISLPALEIKSHSWFKAKCFFNIINPLLTMLFRSRWLDISLVLFFFAICLDHDFVSVHKKAWLMTYLYEKSSLPMWGKYVNQRLHNDWDIKFCNWWSKGYFSLLFGLMFRVLTPNAEESANKIVIVIIVVDRTYSYRNLSKFFYGMVWLRLLLFHSYGILCP